MNQSRQVSEQETVYLRRTFAVPSERLFAAWTKPDLLAQWWGPIGSKVSLVEVDFRVGGQYRIGMSQSERGEYFVRGVYEEIRPLQKLVFTWRWERPDMDIGDSIVTLDFVAQGTATQLTLTHARLPNEAARAMHREGWTAILGSLMNYCEIDAKPDSTF